MIELKPLIKLKYDKINDKKCFIIIDKDANIYQYFYDEEFINKIYLINTIKSENYKKNQINEIFDLIKKNVSI